MFQAYSMSFIEVSEEGTKDDAVSFGDMRMKIWGNEETGSRNIHGVSPSAELNQTTKTKLIQKEAGPILKKESNPIQPVEEQAYDVEFSYIKGACSQ
ncbi:hypothetical protein EPI10_032545 [Gossypium australe]|uniref:Uncharacterized protein n=1 Tax=Gossypium australe TaxID=47621 RepID=A0A5B6X3M7_9ROSI|nr:hypothetical protein EPI10_032545 [Gossypium australe]